VYVLIETFLDPGERCMKAWMNAGGDSGRSGIEEDVVGSNEIVKLVVVGSYNVCTHGLDASAQYSSEIGTDIL
jgi:hypothetical protein